MRKATIAYVFTALFVLASPSHAGTLSGTVHSPSLERDLPVTLHTPDVTPVQPKRTEPPFEKTPEPDAKKADNTQGGSLPVGDLFEKSADPSVGHDVGQGVDRFVLETRHVGRRSRLPKSTDGPHRP